MNQDNKREEKLLVLAVVGMPATGKSEVLKTLVDKYGFFHLYYGGITLEETKRRGLELTEENERFVREDMRKSGDMGIYSRFMIPKIEEAIENEYKRIMLESMYNIWEYELIKEKYGENFKVLAIHSDFDVRLKRIGSRADRKLNIDELNSRQISEAKNLGKGTVISLADYNIVNNGDDMKVFENDLDYFLKYSLKLKQKLEVKNNIVEEKTIDSFTGWNNIKCKLNFAIPTEIDNWYEESEILLREGEVRWCKWGLNVGDESNGKGKFFRRPVLILKKFSRNVFLGVPTTSQTKVGSWYFNIKDNMKVNTVILNQAKLIDKRRLEEKIVELPEKIVSEIKESYKKII